MRILRALSLPFLVLLSAAADSPRVPGYSAAGELTLPADYREWVYLSTGLNMSYSAAAMAGHAMFDNVFVDPAGWAAFKRTGHWPDKAMFVLEARGASSRGSINKSGQFQTEDRMGLEVHVRDEARFAGGWAFFVFGEGATSAVRLPEAADCYACHRAHGAVDTTFTQFYPTAKPIAVAAGSFRTE
jgi:cytochrome P460